MATRQQEYTVRIDRFEGPLDLLLQLIVRAELDITEISLGTITDQYLEFLGALGDVDVDEAGEFLVLAATLVEIKSRLVSPDEPGDAGGAVGADDASGGDLAAELVRQLLAYKAYRDAALELERRRGVWERRYPLGRAALDRDALRDAVEAGADDAEIEDLGLYDLVEAFQRILDTVQFDRLGAHEVTDDDTPIELHAVDLMDHLSRVPGAAPGGEGVRLRSVFEGRNRAEMVGLFLALLELVRQRRAVVRAEDEGADVRIVIREEEPDAPDAADADGDAPIDSVVAEPKPAAWEDDHLLDDDLDEDEDDELKA